MEVAIYGINSMMSTLIMAGLGGAAWCHPPNFGLNINAEIELGSCVPDLSANDHFGSHAVSASASKLRRLRAKATRRRLFESAREASEHCSPEAKTFMRTEQSSCNTEECIPIPSVLQNVNGSSGPDPVWEPLPVSKASSDVEAACAQAPCGAWMRVEWSCSAELSADDVMDHFQAYGTVSDMEWLDDAGDRGKEVMKLYFESRSSISAILRERNRRVKREADGKLIDVKTYIKFSDNTAAQ